MIDALFGSKTRVKLLHLFMNNPGKSFYVREITRMIDEQINSVRRELNNLLNIGIITSDTHDNKLYYEVNQRYEHYVPFRAIFGDGKMESAEPNVSGAWHDELKNLSGVRLVVLAGVLVKGSASAIDVLVVGDTAPSKFNKLMKRVESDEARELNYSLMKWDEFYYRLSVRDRFTTEITRGKHNVLVDTENILRRQK